MGPCQGGFCTYRAVGIWHEIRAQEAESDPAAQPDSFNANLLLRDFLQERWKGMAPVLWGEQLKQARLDEYIYLNLIHADHLPDPDLRSPLSDFYLADSGSAPAPESQS